jgi:hypothetical protein
MGPSRIVKVACSWIGRWRAVAMKRAWAHVCMGKFEALEAIPLKSRENIVNRTYERN